jgi:hypothetical protein
VATLESTGEEVENYDEFIFQLSDQEIVQGNRFTLILERLKINVSSLIVEEKLMKYF